MNKIAGSIRKVTIEGVSYDTAADVDFSQVAGRYTNDVIATSGCNMRKMIKRSETLDSVELLTSEAEFNALKAISERTDDISMSYVTASGAVYRASGWIEVEKRGTQEGKTSLKMFPRNSWEPMFN